MTVGTTLSWIGRARAVGAALWVSGVLLAGCAVAARDLSPPGVTVVGVSLLESTGGGQRFSVGLLIDNQNTEPLPIKALQFTLRLANGEARLEGTLPSPVVVAALDRQTVRIEVTTDLSSSPSRLLSFVQGPANALPYDLAGSLTIDRRFAKPWFFAHQGEVPLSIAAAGR
jgi:LEA14-like dessication related protein